MILAVKGDFYDCDGPDDLRIYADSYCIVEDGICQGIYADIPDRYHGINIADYSGYMIIPGLVDLHTHAPQYTFRGLGMELELLDWLNTYTFPEEGKYSDMEYADKAYQIFADDLKASWTSRCVVFGTIFKDTTLLLMDKLEKAGLAGYVGKVNMDRNSPEYYVEDTEKSLRDTESFIEAAHSRFNNIKPIITPRFIPSCTDDLMKKLGTLRKKTNLPVQSHLSENPGEIQWVKELVPDSKFYGDAYDMFGLFGGDCPTIMAHCVYSGEDEISLIKERGVYVAHCPGSNNNLSSGIAPVRKYLKAGINMGLGTDLGAGNSISIAEEMIAAVKASKMRWRYVEDEPALNMTEAFYLATRGGGKFFGNVGCFDKGYEFDAIVLNDKRASTPLELQPRQRLFRSFYLYGSIDVMAKYVKGRSIL